MKFIRIISFLLVLVPVLTMGQTVCSTESRERLDVILNELSKTDVSQKTMNDLTVEIGSWFLNTPYVEKTLEVPGKEKLVINLIGLDCTTFLETVITLARITKKGDFTFDEYDKALEFLRYRQGIMNGYPSRLHYFSDWIYDNQQKGVLKDITHEIGGEYYANKVTFMSTNTKYYPQLTNEAFIGQIKQTEAEISARTYYYLPKEQLESHEDNIRSGDLIAITTTLDNMDISHVGFAIEKNGRIHLLHASSSSKKVEITEIPLSDYLMSHKSQSGIMVCRLIAPN